MTDIHSFKTNYIYRCLRKDYNPFTPDRLSINHQTIEHRRRNWFLISEDKKVYHFQNIIGIDVDKWLFGADITIQTTGKGNITIRGFSKSIANEIVEFCSQYITKNTSRNAMENLGQTLVGTMNTNTQGVVSAIESNKGNSFSVADELHKLKNLLDQNLITQEEFDYQKRKLMQ